MIEQMETDRLCLRLFEESDLDAYAEMCGDAEVMKYLGGVTMSRSEAWRNMATVLGRVRDQGKTIFVVTHQAPLMEPVADEFVRMAAGQIVARESMKRSATVIGVATGGAR